MPSISIRIADCAYSVVRNYSAPKIRRLRRHLQDRITVLYPEDARDAGAAALQLRRAMRTAKSRPRLPVIFEDDAFMLRFEREGWALFLVEEPATPPDDEEDEPDAIDGGEGGGADARRQHYRSSDGGEPRGSSTLDTLISEQEISAICAEEDRRRPAARKVAQDVVCPRPARIGRQGLMTRWVRALWASLSRSRTLVPNAQARQSASDDQARPLGSIDAAIPPALSGIEDTGLELHTSTVQVGPHLLSIRVWRRKSPDERRQRRGLFGKKTHNKRLYL